MVGFGMILDSQEEDTAIRKAWRFEEQASDQTNDIDPPPYTEPSLPPQRFAFDSEVAFRESITSSLPSPFVVNPPPQPSVSQLHIVEKHAPISGTFYVDPQIPSVSFHARGERTRKKNPPHASFRTRHGPISLNLGTTGDATSLKANVLVTSRHGNVNVNLLPTSSLRPTMRLEINTRRGDIVLFVPRDFSGAIQLSTHKGRIEFLPAFASQMRVMKQSQKDGLVMLGGQTVVETRDLNFCELETRRGRIVIGLSDIDKHDSPPGFWKRLFGHS